MSDSVRKVSYQSILRSKTVHTKKKTKFCFFVEFTLPISGYFCTVQIVMHRRSFVYIAARSVVTNFTLKCSSFSLNPIACVILLIFGTCVFSFSWLLFFCTWLLHVFLFYGLCICIHILFILQMQKITIIFVPSSSFVSGKLCLIMLCHLVAIYALQGKSNSDCTGLGDTLQRASVHIASY